MKFAGEVAVVTGAGRGIGRAIALMQASEGAKIALIARTTDAVAEEIAAQGGIARAYPLDIVDLGGAERTFVAVERDLGPVSLLINNAGLFTAFGPIWTVDPETWWRDVETNIRGTVQLLSSGAAGHGGEEARAHHQHDRRRRHDVLP
jgi:NAD(P)-dependent dehydrogenase (short-subunit alcohol dehydrogenase family)